MATTTAQPSIYETITNKVIEKLEQGVEGQWVMPWRTSGKGLPKNVATGNAYQGINITLLCIERMVKGYASNIWGTYTQWQDKGCQVRKGEKATTIVFYTPVEKTKTNEAGETIEDKFFILKSFSVFNAEQVEGYVAEIEEGGEDFANDAIEAFIANTGADVRYGNDRAYYSVSGDYVAMPNKGQFIDTANASNEAHFYSVLFHELTHWTGAEKRLNRALGKGKTTQDYAKEELVAELGSMFLSMEFGVNDNVLRDDHVIYIKGWLEALRSDSKFIFKASSDAQKAVTLLKDGLTK